VQSRHLIFRHRMNLIRDSQALSRWSYITLRCPLLYSTVLTAAFLSCREFKYSTCKYSLYRIRSRVWWRLQFHHVDCGLCDSLPFPDLQHTTLHHSPPSRTSSPQYQPPRPCPRHGPRTVPSPPPTPGPQCQSQRSRRKGSLRL
jgi:hypothetical protein